MLKRTNIGWADYSGGDLNFVIGCTPISEGCANCYARTWARRAGKDFSNVTVYWQKLNRLRKAKWKPGKEYYRRGPLSRPIMFPCDLSDLFHPEVPENMILTALDIFAARTDADWVLLTKRPDRMLDATDHWLAFHMFEMLPPNIWCLATCENQQRADERIPILLQVRAQVLGVSLEPILEPIVLSWYLYDVPRTIERKDGSTERSIIPSLNWVIVGAESGPDRRPFEVAWAEDVYEQCAAAGVPFFGKQDSGLKPGVPLLIEGREIKEFPRRLNKK